jgi:hypothetical protein
MRSSTSSSNAADPTRAIRALLCLAACVGITLEVGTRLGVTRINRNQRRISHEYRTALTLAGGPSSGRISVLLVGNSLTQTDIDMARLQADLGPGYRPARWAIDDTNYLDWYFGLRHLFRAGARPHVVVIGGTTRHLLASHVRGGYFAHYILHRGDILEAASRTKADDTATTEMFFANWSAFYGSREEINKRLLTWLLPEFPRLARTLADAGRPHSGADPDLPPPARPNRSGGAASSQTEIGTRVRAFERLSELKALCEANGAHLMMWIAPTISRDPGTAAVVAAGQRAGVEVLVPVGYNEIPRERFTDGFHLDATGAIQLTEALAARFLSLLLRQSRSVRRQDAVRRARA